jgi:biotin synthase
LKFQYIIEKAGRGEMLSRTEIIKLLSGDDRDEFESLIKCSDEIRRRYCGDDVHIRALVEFSNHCRRNCNYCGLRRSNRNIERYRMSPQEIIDLALNLDEMGLRTIVLQSGEDMFYGAETISRIVKEIKSKTRLAVTLCVGERSEYFYRLWKEAGADRYLLRHEAANRDLFEQLHPDTSYDERFTCLETLRNLGFQTGIGCMIGVPGQNIEHLADDIEFIQSFQPDMVGIGPFIAHPSTSYAGYPNGEIDMTLKMVALARIVTRNALIPATTAIGSIKEDGRELALMAGADVVMPNYTPLKYRVHYEIYPNKRCITEDPVNCHGCMRLRVASVGRSIAEHAGHTRKLDKTMNSQHYGHVWG